MNREQGLRDEITRLHNYVREIKTEHRRDRNILIGFIIISFMIGLIMSFNILLYLVFFRGWFISYIRLLV